jgi:RNA polymerase sigma-70 factor, ECF subfamily
MSSGVETSSTTDEAWLLVILESQQRLIRKVCWAYTRSPEDRDDLFQDIALRLLSARRNYDSSRRLSTWVYRVALNVAIDFHRRRQRRKQVTLNAETVPQASDLEANDQLEELRELMERQNEIDRALLLLYLDGNSHREIADVLGISESNVGTRLNRLKQKLRETISVTTD